MDNFRSTNKIRNGFESDFETQSTSSSIQEIIAESKKSSPVSTIKSQALKRKRRSSITSMVNEQELQLENEPPAAKRHHRLTRKESETSSISSSVYSSPAEGYIHEIDTHSSSECLSTVNEYDSGTSSSESGLQNHHGQRTPHSNKTLPYQDDYVCMTPGEADSRMCPLPALAWANASDVWSFMCKKDEQATFTRDAQMLGNHPDLQLRMRAILLDWLIEVCEVYKLHRETFFLAVDFLDRYLSKQKKIQKTHLQLIGITCLFIAAKVEEIYPPKINEFAYVTDGACQEEDILQHELLLLQTLDWRISPLTSIGWLGVYMQLNVSNRTPASLTSKHSNKVGLDVNNDKKSHEFRKINSNSSNYSDKSKNTIPPKSSDGNNDDAFIFPQFSGMEFAQAAQLLDLCSMDVTNANFSYSTIAAAAISHTFSRETALRVSGLEWHQIQPCAKWMESFFEVICEEYEQLYLLEQNEQISSRYGLGHVCPNIVTDDSHTIQTHTTTMSMFDRVILRSEEKKQKKIKLEASPAIGLICPEGLLTPPSSSRKPDDGENIENIPHLPHSKTL